ncbi:hypothetical protein [Alicyclobacillus dauci]|uniref:Uncharacterized protein n=1 Tax=Alicyclobacillus dauci TaxID=1475485 RepID=A0ABY6Z9Y0_9BACL|nr:hypothetical protein [Alicyclobacillus dauci]WAH39333.1 hypothetical protein NZD86_02850 [Alicyclobacillus dauci]
MPRKLLTDAQLGILQVMSSRQQGGIDPNSGLPMGFYTSMIDLFNPSQPAKSQINLPRTLEGISFVGLDLEIKACLGKLLYVLTRHKSNEAVC